MSKLYNYSIVIFLLKSRTIVISALPSSGFPIVSMYLSLTLRVNVKIYSIACDRCLLRVIIGSKMFYYIIQ